MTHRMGTTREHAPERRGKLGFALARRTLKPRPASGNCRSLHRKEEQMTTRMGTSFVAFLSVGMLIACASGTANDANYGGEEASSDSSSERAQTSKPASSYSEAESHATADACEDRPCMSDSDCCKGTACGMDPERSHVQRYCLGM